METPNDTTMRRKILQTAAGLFTAHGYDGVSMREISEACGLSKPGLYYHFFDKETLFLAVLEDHLEGLSALLDQIEQSALSPRKKLSAFIRAVLVDFPADQRAIIRLASQEIGKLNPTRREAFNQQYETRFTGRLAALLAAGIAADEFRALDPQAGMWALLGMMYPFFNLRFPQNGMDAEAAANLVDSVFFEGIAR